MRWAIRAYQDGREAENKVYEKAINELLKEVQATDDNIDKVRLLCDQHEILGNDQLQEPSSEDKSQKKKIYFVEDYKSPKRMKLRNIVCG